ncbi:MAG: septum formation initiator family protein [Spirochaetales bacterium]|nr:septum formation initiator family protein [Spirochaetales bacterium]
MIVRRILSCCYFGFAVYIVLSLFFGRGGLANFKVDLDYKARLEANIRGLQEINRNLSLELKAVRASPDTIKVFARDYGYYAKNEEVIKIQGAPARKNYSQLGSLLKRNPEHDQTGALFHVIGLAGAAVAFAFSMALMRPRPHDHLSG